MPGFPEYTSKSDWSSRTGSLNFQKSDPIQSMTFWVIRSLVPYSFFPSRKSFCTAALLFRTRKKFYGRTSVFAPLSVDGKMSYLAEIIIILLFLGIGEKRFESTK